MYIKKSTKYKKYVLASVSWYGPFHQPTVWVAWPNFQ